MANYLIKNEVNRRIVESFNASSHAHTVSSIEEVLDLLSIDFANNYKNTSSYLDAFYLTSNKYTDIFGNYGFIYSLPDTTNLRVKTGDNFCKSNLPEYIDIVRDTYYNQRVETLEDILSLLNLDIKEKISSMDCDVFTAYNTVMANSFPEFDGAGIFVIDNSEITNPKIELLY